MSYIELNNISKVYGRGVNEIKALKNVNININKGESIAIMGASGSGKSTLLNILGILDNQTSGNYVLNNKDISNYKEKEKANLRNEIFGFVVQDFALVEDYKVWENVAIPLTYSKKKLSRKEKKQKIEIVLKELRIREKENVLSSNLSGGQRQRVAIARAIINNPEIILADEPTGSVDSKTSEEILEIFKDLNKRGKTIVIVTHDINIAKHCNRIINIKDGIII